MQISENSKVWIYQSNRAFTDSEKLEIEGVLNDFTSQWAAHGYQLTAKAEVRYHRFIVLTVDESQAGASGCSIDKSMQIIKQFEQNYNVNLFDRFNIAFRQGEKIVSLDRNDFEAAIQKGEISEDTIVFNNLVQTKNELDNNWEISFKNSWHAKVFDMASAK